MQKIIFFDTETTGNTEKYFQILGEIDKYVQANKFDEDFSYQVQKLIQYADTIDSTQLYKPVFRKVSDLYKIIRDKSKSYEKLKEDNDDLKKKLENSGTPPAGH